ncbi:MAG TPA: hypothetical protein VIP11_01840, partial [Gemmatimonadaceae bacterium]
MSFRTKLLFAFSVATLVSLSLLALGIRRQVTTRLIAQHQRRVDATARVAIQDLELASAGVSERLASLARSIANDNAVRLALRGASSDRATLLDWAGGAMRTTGLSMLQLQDASGRILSSGHFRNEFDRLEPALPQLLAQSTRRLTVATVRAPEGPFLVLAREDSVTIGDRHFTLVGGVTVDRALLRRFARDSDVTVSLVTPEGVVSSDSVAGSEGSRAEQPLDYIDVRSAAGGDSV